MIVWQIALLAVCDAANTAVLHLGGTLILQQTIYIAAIYSTVLIGPFAAGIRPIGRSLHSNLGSLPICNPLDFKSNPSCSRTTPRNPKQHLNQRELNSGVTMTATR